MSTEETLRRWVRELEVRWQLSPLFEARGNVQAQIGYQLELFARHTSGPACGNGCGECRGLYERLRAIAFFALPQVNRPRHCEIAPLDTSFHLQPGGGSASEVRLILRLFQREGAFDPRDPCDSTCAREIEQWLRALEVEPRAWPEDQWLRGAWGDASAGVHPGRA